MEKKPKIHKDVDKKVDSSTTKNSKKQHKKSASHHRSYKKSNKSIPMLAIILFVSLFGVSLFMLFKQSKSSTDALIIEDATKLKAVFEQIHKDCQIIGFEHIKNYIDFLTVKEFVGSEIGAMNLTYPKNWKGPYVHNNPTVQEQQYIILKNQGRYYLVPGDGVILGNGKKVGKDIILDAETDMSKVLQDPNGLKSVQGQLGVELNIGTSYVKQVLQTPLKYL